MPAKLAESRNVKVEIEQSLTMGRKVGSFISLLAVLAFAVLAGSWIEALLSNDSPDEPVGLVNLKTDYAKKSEQVRKDHATKVFQKRMAFQGARDLTVPKREQLEEYLEIMGDDTSYAVPIPMAKHLFKDAMTSSRRLSNDVVGILQIKPEQRQKADDVIWRAWVTLAQEEVKHATVTIPNKDHVKITIKPFREFGQKIKKTLVKDLNQILGVPQTTFLLEGSKNNSLKGLGGAFFACFGDGYKMEVTAYKTDRRRWRLNIPCCGFGRVIPAYVGRYFDKFPPEVQKRIPKHHRHLPTLAERGLEATQK
jgi:hypothetical protein